MRKLNTFMLSVALIYAGSVFADQPHDTSSLSFKELGQMLDEQLNILAEQAENMHHQVAFNIQPLHDTDFVVKATADYAEIYVKVPNVENSENIKAQINSIKGRSKVVVPQKESITKIIISKDRKAVDKIVSHKSEAKHENKHGRSYQMSTSRQVEMRSLPFDVDLSDQKVEYKENDMLVITVSKAKETSAQKAQPRIIPIKNK